MVECYDTGEMRYRFIWQKVDFTLQTGNVRDVLTSDQCVTKGADWVGQLPPGAAH